jgi:hypothetical protein
MYGLSPVGAILQSVSRLSVRSSGRASGSNGADGADGADGAEKYGHKKSHPKRIALFNAPRHVNLP